MWNLKLLAVYGIAISTLLAGTAWYSYNSGKQSGKAEVQAKWDAETVKTQAAQAEEMMKARQREDALMNAMTRIRQEKQREAVRLVNDYVAVVNSLHDRPETRAGTGGVPTGAEPGVGCTGAGLAKRDAEFLAGYSRDAAKLQLALDTCIIHSTEIERALNGKNAP
jgi:hypothetical protein